MTKILSQFKCFVCLSLTFLLAGCAASHAVPVEDLSNAPPISAKADQKQQLILLLPKQGDFAHAGQVIQEGFLAGYQQAGSPPNIRLTQLDVDSYSTPNVAYQTAAAENPNLIVGPLTKPAVNALSLQASLPVQTLALNQSDPNAVAPLNLFQFSLNPQADAKAVAQKMIQAGIAKTIVIAPVGDWGQGIASSFGQTWLAQNGQIIDSLAYDAKIDLNGVLNQLLQSHSSEDLQNTSIFLVATSRDVPRVAPALKAVFPQAKIYALPMIFDGTNQAALENVNFATSPWMLNSQDPMRQAFQAAHPDASGQDLNLYAFALDAYSLAQYQLKTGGFEGLALQGHSGYLTIDTNGVIQRQLNWVTVKNGQVVSGIA